MKIPIEIKFLPSCVIGWRPHVGVGESYLGVYLLLEFINFMSSWSMLPFVALIPKRDLILAPLVFTSRGDLISAPLVFSSRKDLISAPLVFDERGRTYLQEVLSLAGVCNLCRFPGYHITTGTFLFHAIRSF